MRVNGRIAMTTALEFVRHRNSSQWRYVVHGKAAQLTVHNVVFDKEIVEFLG
jgi:hypothetical protein